MGKAEDTLRNLSNPQAERLIGRYSGVSPGPMLLAIGGMHGNEPAGVAALIEVIAYLKQNNTPFNGDLVAVSGNLGALRTKQRFIHRDLNRMWIMDQEKQQLAALTPSSETDELQQVYQLLKSEIQQRRGPAIFLDLHTTSGESPPFLVVGDTLQNRKFTESLPAPLILGLEEQIEGPLLSYCNEFGHTAIGFESGQHDDPRSIENNVSMLWLILEKAGCVQANDIPEYQFHMERLRAQIHNYHKVYEVLHRKAITQGDEFEMRPGYLNFQKIKKGEVLAIHNGKKVITPNSGFIFMPLYQVQGEDGFFVIRKVAQFWIYVSYFLRGLHLDPILQFLPGVKKHPRYDSALVVNKRVARFYRIQVFHLLGYRKKEENKHFLVVKKRVEKPNNNHTTNGN